MERSRARILMGLFQKGFKRFIAKWNVDFKVELLKPTGTAWFWHLYVYECFLPKKTSD